MGRRGVDWAKSLPNYAWILNKDAREELGWKSSFEIYYGRKLNVLGHANDDEVDFEPTIEDIEYKINNRYYKKHEDQIKKLRNHAKRYPEKKKGSSWLKNIYWQRLMMLVRMFSYKGQRKTVYQMQNFDK